MFAAGSAGFVIPRPKNKSGNPRLRNRASTHHARLQRDHKRVIRKIRRIERVTGKPECDHLSMTSGVVVALFGVGGPRNNDSGRVHYERSNGHIARC